MRVKAIRDHENAGFYRKAGEEFEHTGKLHEHIKVVPAAPVEKDNEDGEDDGKTAAKR